MSAAKKPISYNEVRVYKDDGMWCASINDRVENFRFTFTNDAACFVDYVDQMLEAVGLELDEIEWVPVDDTAKSFLNKALKAR